MHLKGSGWELVLIVKMRHMKRPDMGSDSTYNTREILILWRRRVWKSRGSGDIDFDSLIDKLFVSGIYKGRKHNIKVQEKCLINFGYTCFK